MSRFKPDFEPLENSAYYFRPNTAIQAESISPETPATLSELKEILRKFSLGLFEDDLKKFKRASITAKTCAHNRLSDHYWQLIKDFFIQSLKETYPNKDMSLIIKAFDGVNLSQLCKEPVDNITFVIYLLGIIDGLL